MTAIPEISTEDLKTESEIGRSSITLKLIGCAETQVMSELDGYLKRIHASAVEARVPEVVVDMRSLEFMNSSCFKAFVSWINVLQETPQDSQYRVRLVADDKKHWQSRSFGALACFAVDLVRVES